MGTSNPKWARQCWARNPDPKRLRRFFYHYFRHGEEHLSVHFRDTCVQVTRVVCLVPAESHWQARQPRLVMRGWAEGVQVVGQTAFIY